MTISEDGLNKNQANFAALSRCFKSFGSVLYILVSGYLFIITFKLETF
jgi:hypothetical protein